MDMTCPREWWAFASMTFKNRKTVATAAGAGAMETKRSGTATATDTKAALLAGKQAAGLANCNYKTTFL